MSVQIARAFLDKYVKQSPIRTQLYIMNPRTVEDFLQYVHIKTGYSFSQDDLIAALAEYPKGDAVNEIKRRLGLEKED